MGALGLTAACGDPSKQDIIRKGKIAKTKSALEAAPGKPDKLDKLGPIEKWTYTASDEKIVFVITGNSVAIQATGKKQTGN